MMIIIQTVHCVENDSSQQVDNIIITFQMQKITYQGIEGFFIPFSGFKQMRIILNDYVYMQELIEIKNQRIKDLEKLEVMNFKLKTGLAIAISFDVGITLIAVGLGLLTYNLAAYQFR